MSKRISENHWQKVLWKKKKSIKIRQDQKTFIFAFAQFWALLPKDFLWKESCNYRLYLHEILRFPYFP